MCCLHASLQVALVSKKDVVAARIVKGRLERTTLGQVARDISLQFKPGAAWGGGVWKGGRGGQVTRLCAHRSAWGHMGGVGVHFHSMVWSAGV